MKNSKLASPYIIWMVLFIITPLLLIIFFAFTVKTNKGFAFSFQNIKTFFSPIYLQVLVRSLILAGKTTLVCSIIAYPAAYILARSNISHKSTLLMLIIGPMWINMLLRTYSWLTLLENSGIINRILAFFGFSQVQLMYNEGAVLLGMIYNFLPFMILPIYTVLLKIDKNILEAAKDLGANDSYTFRKIVFPLSIGGLFSGCIMVFVPAMSTFMIPRLLSGGKVTLMGNVIEQQFLTTNNWNFGSLLAVILMIIILFTLFFIDLDDIGKNNIV